MGNIVGANIRQARRGHIPRVTQDDLAARLQALGVGLGQVAISKIERGHRPVTDTELAAISIALNVPIQELFAGHQERLTQLE